MAELIRGLEGVVAATTGLSRVDGEKGVLWYAGYNIHDLAERSSFEETAYLLWHKRLPTRAQLDEFRKALATGRDLPAEALDGIGKAPENAHPLDALRTAVSTLAFFDREVEERTPEATLRKAQRLTAKLPTVVAAFHRVRSGAEPIPPDPTLGHAANFLHMLTGELPDDLAVRALDGALILLADHGLNASTFTARVVASTLADLHSAVVAAMSALRGPLHGGAAEAAMRMLLEVGEPGNAEAYLEERLARREKVMGFGHRVYRTEDPRATHLRKWSQQLGERFGRTKWFEISRRLEEVMAREKGLNCNVDFYSASVYYALGIPVDLYTAIFACSRVVGWSGHVREQYAENRLIRPRAEYTGPTDLKYVPIEERT